MMAPSISSAAATPSYSDPLSQASPSSSSSNAAKPAGQKQFTSSPLSPSSSKTRRSLDRDLSDFSETSITSSSSTVGPPEGEGEESEFSIEQRRSGGGGARGGGGWTAHAGTELHSPIEDDDRVPIIRRSNTDGEGSEAGSATSAGRGNGFTRSLGTAMEEELDTEEQREAKQIQSNLERWAAAERQRRKAARGSRMLGPSGTETTSGSASAGGTSLLGRRLTFGRKNTITQKPSDSDVPGSGTNAVNSHLLRRGSFSNSISSSAGSDYSEARSGDQRGSDSGKGESGRGIEIVSSLRNVTEDEREGGSHSGYNSDASSSARRKGKGRAVDETDPWRPPSAGAQRLAANEAYDRRGAHSPHSASPDHSRSPERTKRSSVGMKPSASRPIVTPGRAASLRRPATQTPQIVVASDEANSVNANNPFMTRGEVAAATAAGIAAAMENGIALRQVNGVIPEGDEDEDQYSTDRPASERRQTSETVRTATSNLTARPRTNGDAGPAGNAEGEEDEARSKRFSTSSKFREIGLDSRNDLSTIGQRRDSRHDDYDDEDGSRSLSRPYSMTSPADYAAGLERGGRRRREEEMAEEDRRIIREGRGRQTWWTEWLCGCGRVIDDDNEQTGKTGPE